MHHVLIRTEPASGERHEYAGHAATAIIRLLPLTRMVVEAMKAGIPLVMEDGEYTIETREGDPPV